ncbi:hypothetical protein [Salsuginibacillus kocurii]|uniref:hypothetical protein n=1 Tax=Salsuginibacillus kocurii TaxID=427078 RepID=UPI0003632789|nr:hypothetical protein [Salsuginibacillus kocurii]
MGNSNYGEVSELLNSFPTDFPVSTVILQGQSENVTNFVSYDEATGITIFRNGAETKVYDCSKISGLKMD